MRNPIRWAIAALAIIIVAGASYWVITTRGVQPDPIKADGPDLSKHPKLVVLVVFDQLRGDYPKKWQPLFGDGGFKRLQKDGAWFTNCHYPYAYTLTAAGHTSLVTGTTPNKHGIIANEWVDRSIGGEGVASTTPPPEEKKKGGGPYRRKAESVGDVLMRVLTEKSRVASFSIKERAAVLMAALRANMCYWFNSSNGNFVTSAYYRPDPHSWATKFNKERSVDQWLNKSWEKFDAKLDYEEHSSKDNYETEGTGYVQGRSFPHKFQFAQTKDAKANKQNYFDAVACSPMGNELLLAFAKTAIEAEKLGQGDSVDLLCISFSSNDLIGHTWGPDSQEVLDVTLRSDVLIKEFLGYLDEKVGKDNYYFALSADHGVCPLPEFAHEHGLKAGRVEPEILTTRAEEFLNQKYLAEGKKKPWFILPKRGNAWVYFNYATLEEMKLKRSDVEKSLADWYNTQSGIERAFTRTEVMKEEAEEQTELFRQVQRSFHSDCSGDVMVILKPYHMFSPPNLSKNPAKNPTYRATHGMPHSYDTHVPLMVLGPRIEPGVRDAKVTPQAMASILAEALRVPAPKDATYALPEELFKK
jgi:predicted AlkP superfamily pyrophosphatase or phosphodiesterase